MSTHTLMISIDVVTKFDGAPDGELLNDVKRRLETELHEIVYKHFVGKAEIEGYNTVFEWDPSDEDDDE
jgi:hypothetical protein